MTKTDFPTFVFIDASNIKYACRAGLGIMLDFKKLLKYFKSKYPQLNRAIYYEGIAREDTARKKFFDFLKRIGYEVHSLNRKSYREEPIIKTMTCEKCGYEQEVNFLSSRTKVKSNVDVYLATDMMEQASSLGDTPAHFIIMSCDGDYRETIISLLRRYPNLHISILATPFVKPSQGINFLSSRLRIPPQQFNGRYRLIDITSISKYISK